MVNCFTHILKMIDLFGQPVNLTIEHQTQAKTVIGGIMTLLALIGILVFGIYSAEDFYKQLNPTVTKTTYSHSKAFDFQMTKTDFPFALNYENPDYDESLVSFKGEYRVFNASLDDFTVRKTLIFRRCVESDFPFLNSSQFDTSITKKSYCIDNLDFELFGSFVDQVTGYISIDFVLCDKSDGTNPNCTDENIQNMLNQGYFVSLRMMNVGIDPMNKQSPFNYFVENINVLPTFDHKKVTTMNIKKEVLLTDDGWLMKNEFNKTKWSYDSSESDFRLRMTLELMNIRILASNKEIVTKRVYLKIQNAIANIGGILSVVTTAMPFVTMIFSITRRDEVILNKIFDYDYSPKTKANIELSVLNEPSGINNNNGHTNLKQISSGDLTNISGIKDNQNNMSNNNISDNYGELSPTGRKTINDNTTRLDPQKILDLKYNNVNRKKLEFSLCDILLCGCCASKELSIKRKLYKKSQDAVSDYFEISYIITKLDELDKLQYVLLTNEQMAMFKFISKDICSLNEYKMKNNPVHRSRSLFNDEFAMAKMYLDYKDALINGGRIQTRIDKRLMCLLNEDVKNVDPSVMIADKDGDISKNIS